MKTKIYKLYRLTAKLNLYLNCCDVKKDRVIEELTDIEELVKNLLEQIKVQKKRSS